MVGWAGGTNSATGLREARIGNTHDIVEYLGPVRAELVITHLSTLVEWRSTIDVAAQR